MDATLPNISAGERGPNISVVERKINPRHGFYNGFPDGVARLMAANCPFEEHQKAPQNIKRMWLRGGTFAAGFDVNNERLLRVALMHRRCDRSDESDGSNGSNGSNCVRVDTCRWNGTARVPAVSVSLVEPIKYVNVEGLREWLSTRVVILPECVVFSDEIALRGSRKWGRRRLRIPSAGLSVCDPSVVNEAVEATERICGALLNGCPNGVNDAVDNLTCLMSRNLPDFQSQVTSEELVEKLNFSGF